MFMGIPDRWYEDATWLCENGHVSKHYLKSSVNGAVCLGCLKPVRMVAPETTEELVSVLFSEDGNA